MTCLVAEGGGGLQETLRERRCRRHSMKPQTPQHSSSARSPQATTRPRVTLVIPAPSSAAPAEPRSAAPPCGGGARLPLPLWERVASAEGDELRVPDAVADSEGEAEGVRERVWERVPEWLGVDDLEAVRDWVCVREGVRDAVCDREAL